MLGNVGRGDLDDDVARLKRTRLSFPEAGGVPGPGGPSGGALTHSAVHAESFTSALAASVPEPGAWALMILGFGGAGAVIRRRRAVHA